MALAALASPAFDRLTSRRCCCCIRDRHRRRNQLLILGHVFVANMNAIVICLRFCFIPAAGVDRPLLSSHPGDSSIGTVIGGRLARHLREVREWITAALGMEVVVLMVLALLAGIGILGYHDNTKLILIAGIARTARCRSARATHCAPCSEYHWTREQQRHRTGQRRPAGLR